MNFIVERTSLFGREKSPCEEAKRKSITFTENLKVDDPAKISYYKDHPCEWTEKGKNHRVVDGNCMRDISRKVWVVNLKSVAAIKEFVSKYGECVINCNEQNENIMTIEIYDDYRE